jgi:hypothetical protein
MPRGRRTIGDDLLMLRGGWIMANNDRAVLMMAAERHGRAHAAGEQWHLREFGEGRPDAAVPGRR